MYPGKLRRIVFRGELYFTYFSISRGSVAKTAIPKVSMMERLPCMPGENDAEPASIFADGGLK
jgi:hypothetical protein